ncbi:MAG: hypothetical protein WDW36_001323 [Sanguina aurantia]
MPCTRTAPGRRLEQSNELSLLDEQPAACCPSATSSGSEKPTACVPTCWEKDRGPLPVAMTTLRGAARLGLASSGGSTMDDCCGMLGSPPDLLRRPQARQQDHALQLHGCGCSAGSAGAFEAIVEDHAYKRSDVGDAESRTFTGMAWQGQERHVEAGRDTIGSGAAGRAGYRLEATQMQQRSRSRPCRRASAREKLGAHSSPSGQGAAGKQRRMLSGVEMVGFGRGHTCMRP